MDNFEKSISEAMSAINKTMAELTFPKIEASTSPLAPIVHKTQEPLPDEDIKAYNNNFQVLYAMCFSILTVLDQSQRDDFQIQYARKLSELRMSIVSSTDQK